MIKVFAGVFSSMSIRLLRSCFIRGQASSLCHDFLLLFSLNLDCQCNMIRKLRYKRKALKSTPLAKGALLIVMFEWRFHIKISGNVSKKL